MNPCKRLRYDNTAGVLETIPSGVTINNPMGHLVEVETDTCASPITQASIITDEWNSFSVRGEPTDTWESTLHSGGYYHTKETFWDNGAPHTLEGYLSS